MSRIAFSLLILGLKTGTDDTMLWWCLLIVRFLLLLSLCAAAAAVVVGHGRGDEAHDSSHGLLSAALGHVDVMYFENSPSSFCVCVCVYVCRPLNRPL